MVPARSPVPGLILAACALVPAAPALARQKGQEDPNVQVFHPDRWTYATHRSFRDHWGPVTVARQKGRWMLTAGKDKTVRLWDAQGKPLGVFRGHKDWIWGLAIHPKESRAASAGRDGRLILWGLPGGEELKDIEVSTGTDNYPLSVALHPTQPRAAVGMRSGLVAEYDLDTEELIEERRASPAIVYSVAYSADGQWLAATGNTTFTLWNLENAEEIHEVEAHLAGDVRGIAYSPTGRLLATVAEDGYVKIWDTRSRNAIAAEKVSEAQRPGLSVAFGPNDRYVAAGGSDGTILIHDIDKGEPVVRIAGHQLAVYSVSFDADGRQVASASLDGTLKIWSAIDGREQRTMRPHGGFINRIAYTPDGRYLAIGGVEYSVKFYSAGDYAAAFKLAKEGAFDDTITALAFSRRRDGEVAVGHAQGQVVTWSYGSQAPRLDVQGHSLSTQVADATYSWDGRYLITVGADTSVRVWDLHNKGEHRVLGHEARVTAVAAHPKEDLFVSCDVYGGVLVTRMKRKGDEKWFRENIEAHEGPVNALAFSPDGGLVASGGNDGKVVLSDPKKAKVVRTLEGHTGPILALAFHPDGKTLASSSRDGTVRIWRVEDGTALLQLTGYQDEVLSLAFHPEGEFLATGTADGETRIWKRVEKER